MFISNPDKSVQLTVSGQSLKATSVQPLTPALRNQFNVGLEQQLGSKLSAQAEYFWKFTGGA